MAFIQMGVLLVLFVLGLMYLIVSYATISLVGVVALCVYFLLLGVGLIRLRGKLG